jgi:hypothetical protein
MVELEISQSSSRPGYWNWWWLLCWPRRRAIILGVAAATA